MSKNCTSNCSCFECQEEMENIMYTDMVIENYNQEDLS